MGGYLPNINRLFVVFALVVRWNTTDSELHVTDAIFPLERNYGSWTWRHWSLRRVSVMPPSPVLPEFRA
jgi:hypothetical protein